MSTKWRTVDIVVVAVLAVAFGVIFWGWDALWNALTPVFTFFPPAQAILYGTWLLPAVLGGLIIRKPGAAVIPELVASIISSFLGNKWGVTVVWQGLLEGLGAELFFLVFLYRWFKLPVAVLAAVGAGLAATIFDAVVWYSELEFGAFKLPYVAIGTFSALLIAGVGGYYLTRALAATGVLDRFPSGRDRELV
ncbi:ABC transporter permease [Longispora fulva]|uniref:Energy-coupling factor transport system substrate-specific component n=1 Tax=Longispora fulva TaxID=619741 RepID=A0A8J7KHI1_9ACTN|nr:ECF transporter S component [Longispora fulva]MBG6138555.1 energy-coupling factor transport system substrate-specific component [Longispora fulva]GIG62340.1 ABC transporter permease [Longispora fulva]